ncbi:MAG: questin oxidase family protein [bacterium]|nr:questin oxidase family protein [bacterium]
MAAEAMTTLGSHTIPSEWHAGARYYRAELARDESGDTGDPALGERDRHGDWLDHFRRELERQPWREALGQWVPVLAPGLGGAMFHGLIRTAHAVRALRRRTSRARQDELAAGLAYWASCYTTLPTHDQEIGASDIDARHLADLEHPWLADRRDVDFHATMARLTANPLTPRVRTTTPADPTRELRGLLRAAATAFLEMLVQERHRIWLLHGFTGPAAIDLLLPELSAATGQGLVKHAAQATIALFAAYGAPFEPGAHVRGAALPWAALAQEAIARRSIHGLKLIEALRRSDDDADLLLRSVAAQWLEWV